MPWLQLCIHTQREQSPAIEDALLAAGAVSVTMEDAADQPILEPALGETPLWNETRIIGLFEADTDTERATAVATADYGAELPSYRWEILEDKDWERAWMDNFHPMRFGQRLWICPSWRLPPEPDAINLLLDPGLAFGTGTHPTTALCLQWLDSLDLRGKTVLDYGCGSGILGLAALLLGAKHLIAVDNDPQALQATKENAKRNNIDPQKITTCLPQQVPDTLSAEIIVANILAGPLVALAPQIAQYAGAGALLALSGILLNQAQTVGAGYQQWFDLNPPTMQQEWVRLDGCKRPD